MCVGDVHKSRKRWQRSLFTNGDKLLYMLLFTSSSPGALFSYGSAHEESLHRAVPYSVCGHSAVVVVLPLSSHL